MWNFPIQATRIGDEYLRLCQKSRRLGFWNNNVLLADWQAPDLEGGYEQAVNGVGYEELQRDSISVEDVIASPALN